jgi:hypothetical protein
MEKISLPFSSGAAIPRCDDSALCGTGVAAIGSSRLVLPELFRRSNPRPKTRKARCDPHLAPVPLKARQGTSCGPFCRFTSVCENLSIFATGLSRKSSIPSESDSTTNRMSQYRRVETAAIDCELASWASHRLLVPHGPGANRHQRSELATSMLVICQQRKRGLRSRARERALL